MEDLPKKLTSEQIAQKRAYFQAVVDSPYTGGGRKPGRRYHDWVRQKDHALWALRMLENNVDPGPASHWRSFRAS